MSEKEKNRRKSHHETDEAKLSRLEEQVEIDSQSSETVTSESKPKKMFAWILTAVIIALVGIGAFAWIASKKSGDRKSVV